MWEIGLVSAVPFPWSEIPEAITNATSKLISLHRQRHEGDEVCRDFAMPDLRRIWKSAERGRLELDDLLAQVAELERAREESITEGLARLDAEAFDLYGLSPEDRALVEREIARRPQSESGYAPAEIDEAAGLNDEEIEDEEPEEPPGGARDLVSRWLSHYMKRVIEQDDDGIVPVPPMGVAPGLIVRLQAAVEEDLGKEAASILLSQAPAHLGVMDLVEWLSTAREETIEIEDKKKRRAVGFAPWHVDLYRRRPIFWLFSSEAFEKGATRFRFLVYVHYLKLTPDTLPRLVAHYLEEVQHWVEREWSDAKAEASRLEGRAGAAARTKAEEWLNTADALKGFRKAVEAVVEGPAHSENVPTNAKWLARTIGAVKGGKNLGHGYKPDVDFGVRVNIAPLVERRLFPKAILKKLGG
jgi:hypothetical protein